MDVVAGLGDAVRAQRLAAAHASASAAAAVPRASIVIGSYNRLACLCELLERLLVQDLADFEVVVIEQSTRATDSERDRLAQLAARDARIRVYPRPPLGGAGARNEGCRLARADLIVAFDDDDLPASPRWLSTLLRNFDDPRCLGVSGRHILENGPTPPYRNMAKARRRVLSYSPLMWQWCYPRSDVRSERAQNLMGGNSAFRRSVFERCGLWDEFVRCENENSLFFRLRKHMRPGEYLAFDPDATMIRRLDIDGGMDKRALSLVAFSWRMFEYFHSVIAYYHPARFALLYPAYVYWMYSVLCSWAYNESAANAGRPVRAVTMVTLFGLVYPLVWAAWTVRIVARRVAYGPAKRQTRFEPYAVAEHARARAPQLSAAA